MHVVGISGSLQERSSTAAVLASIADLVTSSAPVPEPGPQMQTATFERFTGLEDLPHFNPDKDVEPVPPAVVEWRAALERADAVVIATPEYAHGYPGALKDALDWIVGSGELVDKPVLLVTASGSGAVRAGETLAPVLEVMSGCIIGPLSIWGVSPKISDGRLTDADDLGALTAAVAVLLSHAAPSA